MRGAPRLALAALLALASVAASAQETPAPEPEKEVWEGSLSLYGYFPRDDRHYAQPTIIGNHGALHMEGRYNYEGARTGSAWVGWNFEAGEELKLEATLMAGAVFGDTSGAAPGYELTLTYKKLDFYSEGEYVFDFTERESNFFYNWSQLGWSATDWLKLGIAAQRTRAYHTDRDIQRGVFAGFTWNKLALTVYVFEPGGETPTVVGALTYSF